MNDEHNDIDDEKPLDPQMEKVRRKMVRLLVVSLSIMFISIFAVLAGVFYKIKNGEETDGSSMERAFVGQPDAALSDRLNVTLPKGFEINHTDLDGNRLAIFGRSIGGEKVLLIVDLTSGEVLSEVKFMD